jgi:hypothetical protein
MTDIGADDLLSSDGIEAARSQGAPMTARSFALTFSEPCRV